MTLKLTPKQQKGALRQREIETPHKQVRTAAERGNFPTDLYMLEGLIGVRGGKHRLVLVDDPMKLLTGGIDLSDVAVVLLTHVSYRSGRMLPMRVITLAVHAG